jgi:hypothetical protein
MPAAKLTNTIARRSRQSPKKNSTPIRETALTTRVARMAWAIGGMESLGR